MEQTKLFVSNFWWRGGGEGGRGTITRGSYAWSAREGTATYTRGWGGGTIYEGVGGDCVELKQEKRFIFIRGVFFGSTFMDSVQLVQFVQFFFSFCGSK